MNDYSHYLASMHRDVDEATRAFASGDWRAAEIVCDRIYKNAKAAWKFAVKEEVNELVNKAAKKNHHEKI